MRAREAPESVGATTCLADGNTTGRHHRRHSQSRRHRNHLDVGTLLPTSFSRRLAVRTYVLHIRTHAHLYRAADDMAWR